MSRQRTPLQNAVGQLISAIQKEWSDEICKPAAAQSEQVMHSAHDLLQAAGKEHLAVLLQGRSVEDFLGKDWAQAHPRVLPFIGALSAVISA